MLKNILKKLLGSSNDRMLNNFQPIVEQIDAKSTEYANLSDEQLKAKTNEFKDRLSKGETLDDILIDAFATAREAAKRTIGLYPFKVQILGGIILHKGMIAEMKTGEGKTLVATMPIYLNALTGKGVHVVTVNDYLAKRDSEWMGKIYQFLGLSVGCILSDMYEDEKKEAYNCDITYGTNHEFGFDYLRDNMKFNAKDLVQREFNFAIVDEVDSILIDEARTPLIISGASEKSSDLYVIIDKIIPLLKEEHYQKDEKERTIRLTESGTEYVENLLKERGLIKGNLYDISNASIVHHLDKALTAHKLFTADVNYLVKDDQVYIIDEFTGRIMDGRRYSDGLHQAIEAKEGVTIQKENQTLASITYQNYFRLYPKLAGMTGTAITEAEEFEEIYKLKCVEIPTNKPIQRIDYDDEIYASVEEKYKAILNLIKDCHDRGQPVLVGTVSIEKSEYLANLIRKELNLNPNVLNAKQHEKEAYIVAEAGTPYTITIATNMAGRGTDIQLGGNLEMRLAQEGENITEERKQEISEEIAKAKEEVLKSGGLYIIGTERHESRRIDNQLRGRSGRQGDKGASKFFLSLEDDLMRIFGGKRIKGMLATFGFKEGEAITHKWLTSALEKAQKKVEAYHFEIRKNLLKYDDVMNEQRKVIYAMRKEILNKEDLSENIKEMKSDCVEDIITKYIPFKSSISEWNIEGIETEIKNYFNIDLKLQEEIKNNKISNEQEVFNYIDESVENLLKDKEEKYGKELMLQTQKYIFLQNLDAVWKEHLLSLDYLRNGIGLRAYGHKDPLNEYKTEAFIMFQNVLKLIAIKTISTLCKAEISQQAVNEMIEETDEQNEEIKNMQRKIPEELMQNIGRNDPCPCGSGKKFKHCHGAL